MCCLVALFDIWSSVQCRRKASTLQSCSLTFTYKPQFASLVIMKTEKKTKFSLKSIPFYEYRHPDNEISKKKCIVVRNSFGHRAIFMQIM